MTTVHPPNFETLLIIAQTRSGHLVAGCDSWIAAKQWPDVRRWMAGNVEVTPSTAAK